MYASPFYASEIATAITTITDPTQKANAASVAKIPTFIWFDQVAKVPQLGTYLADAAALQTSSGQKYIVQIVVYDLPDRDCAAAASNGEFTVANNGLANYENYIDQIVAQVKGQDPNSCIIIDISSKFFLTHSAPRRPRCRCH